MPTVIPFHRAVVDDPAFIGDGESFSVYTQWIETDFDNQITPYGGESAEADEPGERQTVVVEVGGTPARGRRSRRASADWPPAAARRPRSPSARPARSPARPPAATP